MCEEYNDSPVHLLWCVDCRRATELADSILNELDLLRTHIKLMQAVDSLAQEPMFWYEFESDLQDSDCHRIAELFVDVTVTA